MVSQLELCHIAELFVQALAYVMYSKVFDRQTIAT